MMPSLVVIFERVPTVASLKETPVKLLKPTTFSLKMSVTCAVSPDASMASENPIESTLGPLLSKTYFTALEALLSTVF